MDKKADRSTRTPEFTLLESFLNSTGSVSGVNSLENRSLLIYRYSGKNRKTAHLVIKGNTSENIVSFIAKFSPEIYDTLAACMESGSLFMDLDSLEAWRPDGRDTNSQTGSLLEALHTIAFFPGKTMDTSESTAAVSIILCGGKGTRMRSKDMHKVCFPIAGRPAVNRLLDQLESVGIHEHILVVGEKGEQVVREVTEIRDNVVFVYQINQIGTGNAAKQAAYLLRAQEFKGNVLVIPGDKVIERSALERLLEKHSESDADLALMTDDKEFWPDAGRIVNDENGCPVDIIEKREIQKMKLSQRLLALKRKNHRTASRTLLKEIIREIPSLSKARIMFPGLMKYLEQNRYLSLEELEKLIPDNEAFYTIQSGGETRTLSGEEFEKCTPVSNAAVYLFSGDAFYNSIFDISSNNAQNEEYLTDVVRILSGNTSKSYKIIPVPVRDNHEVMSYNNPEELLKIEEYYNRKESPVFPVHSTFERIAEKHQNRSLRSIGEWLRIFEDFGSGVKQQLKEIYGDNEEIISERRKAYLQVLRKFVKVYGNNNHVVIARSPGRVNLMGRHVEHRGGYTNYITINREMLLAAGFREDDTIEIHNVDSGDFRPRRFSISEEISHLPWDEWLTMINSETVIEMIRLNRGDWSNYFKAAALRLQEKFKGRLLYGFNGVLSGQIPLAAGLSSSSAVVVSAAEALTYINDLSFVPKEFVDLCGEGEWFVGTRGGSGDHAAMKFGEKGNILHMRFCEVSIEDKIPFPPDYRLVILQSHQYARKSAGSMQIFNEKVATYEVAHEVVKLRFPQYKDRLEYFRDINTEHLGLKPYEIYNILLSIPEHVKRKDLRSVLDKKSLEHMEKIFSSHNEPEGGYEARRVALFGLAEIARAREFARLMKKGSIDEAAHLMNISHDGDRVTRLNKHGERVLYDNSATDGYIRSLRDKLKKGDKSAALYLHPGGYGCSTAMIDEMVDIAVSIEGVSGAQLSGAGLGGCVMAMVKKEAIDNFLAKMRSNFYEKHNLPPQIFICSPIAGSGIFSL